MADDPNKLEEKDDQGAAPKSGPSLVSLIIAVLAVTVLAAGAGGFLGILLYSTVETAAKHKAEAKEEKALPEYAGDLTVKTMPPVITNLASPANVLVRVEASVIFDGPPPQDAEALTTQISGDTMAFLRTLSLRQIEGGSGLLHLREDLTERAKTRSEGRVREFIIQALAVE